MDQKSATFSSFVKLNQSYENTCSIFDNRAGDRRVLGLSVTEERGDCDSIHGHDDPRDVDHGQKEVDHDCEEDFDVGFERSFAFCHAC